MKRLPLIVLLGVALLISGCAIEKHSITYKVDGAGSNVTIKYTNLDGSSTTLQGQTIPWENRLSTDKPVPHLEISAMSNSSSYGSVTVKLLIDNALVDSQTGSPPFAHASVSN